MANLLKTIQKPPLAGIAALVTVWFGLAIGHAAIVIQHSLTGGPTPANSIVSAVFATIGFTLVWIGLKKPEGLATLLGYVGALCIWNGLFEWTWEHFGHWLALDPVMDGDIPILAPGLQIIQISSLIVVGLLILFGANKDTRCRMFMWFHRNLKLKPGRMTPGYKRQHARIVAIETIFLIWFIYICAITINDPRLIRYDSVAAMAITIGFVVWGIYLVSKLVKIRGLAAAHRYAIPTGTILWLPIEAFSRWGLYPEVWIKPFDYPVTMTIILVGFVAGLATMAVSSKGERPPDAAQPA